jgi:hypothetical protein
VFVLAAENESSQPFFFINGSERERVKGGEIAGLANFHSASCQED